MTSTSRTLAYEGEKPTILARIRARFGTFENPLAPRSDFAGYLLAEGILPSIREVATGPKDGEAPKMPLWAPFYETAIMPIPGRDEPRGSSYPLMAPLGSHPIITTRMLEPSFWSAIYKAIKDSRT
jgi:hypothetical protein